jgi:uncharacterized protein YaaQ
MKMMIVIVKDSDSEALTRALTGAQYRVTGISSTGGFLRSGVATLLIGIEDTQVDAASDLIRETLNASGKHSAPAGGTEGSGEKRATLFVVPVSRFEQV